MLNQKINKNFITMASPLLLIIFIDGMGLGLLFPILNTLIMDPAGGFFTHSPNEGTRDLIYGSTIATYMLCWFFGAALLGDLSDQIGRRKSLLICLLGAFGGYLTSAIAVSIHSLALLIAGRIIAGFTAGSQPIAQAAIVDISEPAHKARNLGLVLLFLSLGFILGPLLGGVLSDARILPWTTFATPLYFAAILSLINAGLLWLLFKETFQHAGNVIVVPHRAITIFISAFSDLKIRRLSIIYFIQMFGWSSFYSFLPLFLLRVYACSSLQISLFMAVMGIGFGIGAGVLMDRLANHFSLKSITVYALAVCTIIVLIINTLPPLLFIWLLIMLLGSAVALACAAFLNIFSNQVDADSQGWIMGISGAIMAFVFGVDGLIVALLANFSAKLPIILSMLGFGIACLAMQFGYKGK